TSCSRDWSADVCSSDLAGRLHLGLEFAVIDRSANLARRRRESSDCELHEPGRVPQDRVDPVAIADQRTAAGLQHATNLGEHVRNVLDIADDAEADDDVECAVDERQTDTVA